ncbi:tail fiber assembly protein [Cronobacter dublinensis]
MSFVFNPGGRSLAAVDTSRAPDIQWPQLPA